MKEGIDILRQSIDNIDSELIRLFEMRMDIVCKVAQYKIENDLPVLDIEREEEVIKRNLHKLENSELGPYMEELMQCLMKLSRDLQEKIIHKNS